MGKIQNNDNLSGSDLKEIKDDLQNCIDCNLQDLDDFSDWQDKDFEMWQDIVEKINRDHIPGMSL